MRALEQVLQAIHDAADDGRRIATVRPLPVVDDTVQPGTSPSAAADPPPAVAASTRSRDIFPTGTLINGSMQG
jgi:hypothetical protein